MRRNIKYYLVNYIPFAYELDKYLKRKTLELIKKKHKKRIVKR